MWWAPRSHSGWPSAVCQLLLGASERTAQEIPRSTGQMPIQMPDLAMTRTLRIMDDRAVGLEYHGPAATPQAGAYIDVLKVHEIALVESTHLSERITTEYHEHASKPVDCNRPSIHWIIRNPASGPGSPQKTGHIRKAPSIVLYDSLGRLDGRPHSTDVFFRAKQAAKALQLQGRKPYVRIYNGKKSPLGGPERSIMIGAKTSRAVVRYDF